MRQIVGCVVLAALFLHVSPLAARQVAGAPASPQTVIGQTAVTAKGGQATINGTVVTPAGQPLADATVRARDLLAGEVEGSTQTATTGQFAIHLKPGNYVLEVVDDAGQIIGTSSFISAVAGAPVSATITIASGALSAVSPATGLLATLGATARGVALAAAAAGVVGAVVPQGTPTASPSR